MLYMCAALTHKHSFLPFLLLFFNYSSRKTKRCSSIMSLNSNRLNFCKVSKLEKNKNKIFIDTTVGKISCYLSSTVQH